MLVRVEIFHFTPQRRRDRRGWTEGFFQFLQRFLCDLCVSAVNSKAKILNQVYVPRGHDDLDFDLGW